LSIEHRLCVCYTTVWSGIKLAFHDADADTDTDTDSPDKSIHPYV